MLISAGWGTDAFRSTRPIGRSGHFLKPLSDPGHALRDIPFGEISIFKLTHYRGSWPLSQPKGNVVSLPVVSSESVPVVSTLGSAPDGTEQRKLAYVDEMKTSPGG